MFERLREAIKAGRRRRGKETGSIMESGIITAGSAGAAGSVAAVVTTPVDVIKTRIMLSAGNGGGREASASPKQQKSGGQAGLVDALGNTKEAAKSTVKSLNPLRKQRGKSAWKVGAEIVAEKGIKGLWRGGALRAVWTFIGSGLYLGVYDAGRIYLAGRRGESVDEQDLM
jgi:hypothetical protein